MSELFGTLDPRYARIEALHDVNLRLTKAEALMQRLPDDVNRLESRVSHIDTRINAVDQTLSRIEAILTEMAKRNSDAARQGNDELALAMRELAGSLRQPPAALPTTDDKSVRLNVQQLATIVAAVALAAGGLVYMFIQIAGTHAAERAAAMAGAGGV